MLLHKWLGQKKEQKVIEGMKYHIQLLCKAFDLFKVALEKNDRRFMRQVIDLESEGDSIRREIIAKIYEGAFLPYLRADLCRFIEIVDRVFDLLEDTAYYYLDVEVPEQIKDECIRVAFLNGELCEMLLITFEAMLKGEKLDEKTLAIRIYEKKIDDLKFGLMANLREIAVKNFWEGRVLAEFISGLTIMSDIMEDAGDYLRIINVSMR
ncbi:TIGR00153 family protein [Thermodesulfobacteriota bacterium]